MEMISNPSNIAVNLESCISHDCAYNCEKLECELCLNCLDDENLFELHEAHREHSKRGGFTRVFPSKEHPTAENLTDKSQLMVKWIAAKCEVDMDWC